MQSTSRFDPLAAATDASSATSNTELERICRLALRSRFPELREGGIKASFYPYIGLTHTIRRRREAWILRISDHCRSAPHCVLESIAIILGCKVLRKRPPAEHMRIYEHFRHDPAVEAMVRERRRRRGRKVIRPAGRYHDLRLYYEEVNRQFFNSQVELRAIGWSARSSWSRLGHFDPVHRTVTISPVLDSPALAAMVLKYLVYHELLHAVLDDERGGTRVNCHTRAFRNAEHAYPDYAEAKRLLDEFCRSSGMR
ncbi:MAG: hypothetical protein HXY20_02310 [Acidobacteria bacterium]|nr:hypothetical protein [Acidobacteriota bacterium]